MLHIKTNFTSGQISKELYGRGELTLYENGARTLTNVTIAPTGGVSRRTGTKFIADLEATTKLISFEFNETQTYLLSFSHYQLKVFKNDELIATLTTPYSTSQLDKLNFTQSADTLLVVHEDVEPQKITRGNDEVWEINPWTYYEDDDGFVYCPYYNFHSYDVDVTPSAKTGTITLTAASEIFTEDYVGVRIKINDGQLEVTEYVSATSIKGIVSASLSSVSKTSDWEESSFSPMRGYPRSVTFHQGRTVIGGSKSLPNRLWLSCSSDLFNFDLGTGLDDESIEFAILSDQVNAIENVISTRHLLVFTTGSEWMVTGEPLTPTSIYLSEQTAVGSYRTTTMQPQNIDGANIFVSSNGKQLREFLFSDVEQAYQGKDLCLMAPDIMSNPITFAFDKNTCVLYIVLADGSVSSYTSYRTEEVSGWSKLHTKGKYESVAIVGEDVYFVINRNNNYYLEKQSSDFYTDCSFEINFDEKQTEIEINDIFEGQEVRVLADDFDVGIYEVINGKIDLIYGATNVKYGYEYEHIIEPLPLTVEGSNYYSPKSYRLIDSQFRIINSQSLRLMYNDKYVEVPLSKLNKDNLMDSVPTTYNGDVEVKGLGWIRSLEKPMWSIHGVEPYAFTLLSVVNNIKTATKGG
ncbi:MAG: hypothetical protein R3Y43_02900 [Alphaproteobacteria bacterium]